jgi:two-component system response regulator PilR (NtrC family)
MLELLLSAEGYEVEVAASGREALQVLDRTDFFDLIITDIRMPDMDGMELLRRVKRINREIPVILITAYASTNTAVEAVKEGATDYIIKDSPFQTEKMKKIVREALERHSQRGEGVQVSQEERARSRFANLIGGSPQMRQVYETIKKVADLNSTVLITGPSGTGKELVASAIHYQGCRRDKPFVAINCGAVPETLLESELFGHNKGSFTGAYDDKPGLFEVADSGTVFLDEIAEMSIPVQVKLLRFLNDKRFKRVGGVKELSVDVRIIAATNRNLREAVAARQFRCDLFYRLNVIPIELPPLSERKEDIVLLADHFVRRFCEKYNRAPMELTQAALDRMLEYEWPGNVRELENVIERIVALELGDRIGPEHLPQQIRFGTRRRASTPSIDFSSGTVDLDKALDQIEREYLEEALRRAGGVKTEAARLLNISFRSFRYRLQKHGLDKEE